MLWLSLGENCLSDDILRRHGLKSFSTPYSSGRTNIDYALVLEQKRYEGLLDPRNLVVSQASGSRVIRSTWVVTCDDLFHSAHIRGFEFTHHDPLSKPADRESFIRKIERLNGIRGRKDVVFLYHHRRTEKTDLDAIREKLREFSAFYSGPDARCFMAFYHQTIEPVRGVRSTDHGDGLLEYAFRTREAWEGNDQDVFWARPDDDLIGQMLSHIEAASQYHAAAIP